MSGPVGFRGAVFCRRAPPMRDAFIDAFRFWLGFDPMATELLFAKELDASMRGIGLYCGSTSLALRAAGPSDIID